MLTLEQEFIYRLRPLGPMKTTKGSPRGERQFWQMTEAEIEGPRLRARAPYPSGDWMSVGPDGWGRPDVRVPFLTDDGEAILLHYTGLVRATEAFNTAADAGGSTGLDEQVMRMAMTFDTGAARYAWLNQSLFLGEGRLNEGKVEYVVYRVV